MTNLENLKEFIINSYIFKINKFCKKNVLNEINNAENIKDETVDFLQTLCERFDYLEESLKRKDRYINWLFFAGILLVLAILTGCNNPCAHTNDHKCQEKIEAPSRLVNNLDFNGKFIPCEVK